MAIVGIPSTSNPMDAFSKGFGLTDNLMNQILNRNQLSQKADQFAKELAFRKQQEARLGANSDLTRQLLEQNVIRAKHLNDPTWEGQRLQDTLNFIQNMGSQQGTTPDNSMMQSFISGMPQQVPQPERPIPQMQDLSNNISMPSVAANPSMESQIPSVQQQMPPQSYMPSIPHYEDPTAQPPMPEPRMGTEPQSQSNKLPGGLDLDTIKAAMIYKSLGLKPPANGVYKEPPEVKRAADLKSKMQLAEFNHNLAVQNEQTKNDLKNEQTRQKTVDSAKNDIPHLETTLRALKVMRKIAEDPKNEDMFGHWLEGNDLAAKRSKNPNAGIWQAYGIDPIMAVESKLSSRGNQLALKAAQANKPNFAEDRSVALAKLKGNADIVQRQIDQAKKIAGINSSSESDGIKELNGKKYKKIKGEWHEVD